MDVRATTEAPAGTGADTIAIGLFEDEGIAHDTPDGALGALVEAGEAKPAFRKLALTHAEDKRWIVAGLGKRDEFDPERARVVAGGVIARARELGARSLCWELPHHVSDAHAAAFVEGSVMGAYELHDVQERRRRGRRRPARRADRLRPPRRRRARRARPRRRRVGQPRARPPEPPRQRPHADRARPSARPRSPPSTTRSRSRSWAARRSRRPAWAPSPASPRARYEEPQLITLRYDGPDANGPVLGFVGKAVTFDSGGISIKPGNKMSDMKFDMSGGAAVLGATAAIARLELPVRLIAVVGATENLPSGRSMKPGDILRARNGTTIEVINTDAEGRLVLADCLHHAVEQGAERLVDLATLTGAIVTTLGTTYAGLMGNDDDWCEEVSAAGRARRRDPRGGCRCTPSTPS